MTTEILSINTNKSEGVHQRNSYTRNGDITQVHSDVWTSVQKSATPEIFKLQLAHLIKTI